MATLTDRSMPERPLVPRPECYRRAAHKLRPLSFVSSPALARGGTIPHLLLPGLPRGSFRGSGHVCNHYGLSTLRGRYACLEATSKVRKTCRRTRSCRATGRAEASRVEVGRNSLGSIHATLVRPAKGRNLLTESMMVSADFSLSSRRRHDLTEAEVLFHRKGDPAGNCLLARPTGGD